MTSETECPPLNRDTEILLNGSQLSPTFKEFAVQTTHGEVLDAIESCEFQNRYVQQVMFKSTLAAINQYSKEELVAHCKADDTEWHNWCNDVLLYVGYRYVLFKTLVQIEV